MITFVYVQLCFISTITWISSKGKNSLELQEGAFLM